jgi:hypothetical protein
VIIGQGEAALTPVAVGAGGPADNCSLRKWAGGVENRLLEFGEGFSNVGTQTLEVGQLVGRDQTKVQLAGIAEKGDVEQVAGRQRTDRMQFLQSCTLDVQVLGDPARSRPAYCLSAADDC